MIKAIAFDLDDTLIDTTHLLVPAASRAAYEAMRAQGLNCDFESFENERRVGALSMKHEKIFQLIARKYNGENSSKLGAVGSHEFYNPPVPETLPLLDGALENLQKLSQNYTLFLVTSGHVQTQSKKVKATRTEDFFQKVYTINGAAQQRKSLAFHDILSGLRIAPTELLSIGNRLSQEIHDAKEIGAKTCYFRFGEHVGEQPRNAFEIPDYTVESHWELIQTCHL